MFMKTILYYLNVELVRIVTIELYSHKYYTSPLVLSIIIIDIQS